MVSEPADILVVEDDPSIAAVLEEILTGKDYPVRVANNPEQAFEAVHARVPELVLMDVNLSADIDGIETIRRMRAVHEDLPVCFITAFSDDETVRRAEEVGPMAYLVKPFEVADVLTMVNISLASSRRMKQRLNKMVQPAPPAEAAAIVDEDMLEDKATGLPNRLMVERLVSEWEEGRQNFLTVLAVDHVPMMLQRFGGAAVEQVMFSFSQHVGEHLPDYCALARWDASTFIVLPRQFNAETKREVARAVATPMLYHLRLPGRSALLRVSATLCVLAPSPEASVAEQIDAALTSLR